MKLQDYLTDFMRLYGQQVRPFPGFPEKELIELGMDLIDEEWREVLEAEQAQDLVLIADGLGDLLYVVMWKARTYGFDMGPILAEIQRSNMSKEWTKEEIDSPAFNQDTMDVIHGVTSGKFVVKDKDNGKVVKSPSYSKADIKTLVETQKQNGYANLYPSPT